MALTSAKERSVKNTGNHVKYRNMNVTGAITIYQGAIVAISGANAINAPATGAAFFMGIAQNTVTNTSGTTTDAPLNVESGQLERFTLSTTPTDADLGKKVYYVADDSVSLTIVGGTGVAESQVGIIASLITGDDIWVDTTKAVSA
jgi:hypothetical protein